VHERGRLHDRRIRPIGPGEGGRLGPDEVHVVPAVERQVGRELGAESLDPAFYLLNGLLINRVTGYVDFDDRIFAEHRALLRSPPAVRAS
jgi:hypothetical protein